GTVHADGGADDAAGLHLAAGQFVVDLTRALLIVVVPEPGELLLDRPSDEAEDRLADEEAEDQGDDKAGDRPPQVNAQVFNVIAERHARVREEVVGVLARLLAAAKKHGGWSLNDLGGNLRRLPGRGLILSGGPVAHKFHALRGRLLSPLSPRGCEKTRARTQAAPALRFVPRDHAALGVFLHGLDWNSTAAAGMLKQENQWPGQSARNRPRK